MAATTSLYPQVVRSLTERPWAVLPDTLAAIRELIALRAQGVKLSDDDIRERIGAASYATGQSPSRPSYEVAAGNVAVLPLAGVITPKADLFSEVSGASSVEGFRRTFREALADPDVGAIALNINSPGGQTDLISELATEIRDSRGAKPIIAVANTLAASAAYWIAAQADEIVATPSGHVGSVGVFAAHTDISGLQEKIGVKTTLISAGKHKTDGNQFEELSDEARAQIQGRVDAAYDMFVADVASGRGVSDRHVRDEYGQGRVFDAKTALSEGMIDRIATLEEAIVGVSRDVAAPAGATAAANSGTFSEHAEAVRAAVAGLGTRTESLAEFRRGELSATKRAQLNEVVAECAAIVDALQATEPDNSRPGEETLTLEDEWALAELGLTT